MSDTLTPPGTHADATEAVVTQAAPPEGIVSVTERALSQFHHSLKSTPDAKGFRLGVVGGGCAGLQYDIKPCYAAMNGDFIQQNDALTFYIHPVAAAYLKGTILDYSDDLVDGGFKFKNPNASNTCGCGTSFGI